MSLVLSAKSLFCERDERVLFNNVHFDLQLGELVQLCGKNGAGKTTCLRGLLSMNTLLEGEIIWQAPFGKGSRHFGEHVIYIGHKSGMSPFLTAEENLVYYTKLRGQTFTSEQIWQALAQVGLRGYEDSLVQQMSAGQQRRVALAQLYLPFAKECLWVLDEPFTALDVQAVANLEQRMVEFSQSGGTVIFTSHQNPQKFAPKHIHLTRQQEVSL